MSKHLATGRVVKLRVSPTDCMAVADIIEKLGLPQGRFSFDQAVRIALSSLIESARQHGVVPTRQGFEFTALMDRFKVAPRAVNLQVSKLLDSPETVRAIAPDIGRDQRRRRFEELRLLHEGDSVNHPVPDLGTPEYLEWQQLCEEFLEL